MQHVYFYQLRSLPSSYLLLLKVLGAWGWGRWGTCVCLSCSWMAIVLVLTGSWEAVLSDPFYV